MAEVKAKATAAPTQTKAKNSTNAMLVNFLIVIACLVVGYIIWEYILGNPKNFADKERHQPNSYAGTMYLGGALVPVLIATLLTLIVFVIERFLTIFKSRGRMSNADFMREVTSKLNNNDINGALAICDKQRGSVGNVMRAGLKKYEQMSKDSSLTQEQKLAVIQKEVEEATALELPMMERNLVFLSTIASVATLLGLFGTVLGMIRAFKAMGQAGAPDANALATGISEALINTALGIGTSAIAIIAYNYFTTIIDNVTYGIDESGFTLAQSFKSKFPA